MATKLLDRFPLQILFRRGTRAKLELVASTSQGLQAEPYYTTDTEHLFIHNGTRPKPVQTLDMAVVDELGNIVTNSGQIVFTY